MALSPKEIRVQQKNRKRQITTLRVGDLSREQIIDLPMILHGIMADNPAGGASVVHNGVTGSYLHKQGYDPARTFGRAYHTACSLVLGPDGAQADVRILTWGEVSSVVLPPGFKHREVRAVAGPITPLGTSVHEDRDALDEAAVLVGNALNDLADAVDGPVPLADQVRGEFREAAADGLAAPSARVLF